MARKRKQRRCRICRKRPPWRYKNCPPGVCKRCYHKEIWPERLAARQERLDTRQDLPDQDLFDDGFCDFADSDGYGFLDGHGCSFLHEDDEEYIDDEAMMRAWGAARRDWEWNPSPGS